MSTGPLARNADLRRLLDDGYDVTLTGGHLVVHQVPYVTSSKEIAYGFLAYPMTVSGDRIVSDTDHRIWFGGEAPCNEHGRPLTFANPEVRAVTPELTATFMLSSKPGPHGYPNHYQKVTAYARILSHPAMALNDTIAATPGGAWQEVEDDLPFRYRDTATTRAGLTDLNRRFLDERVVIIGLGGTGGYVLDQVAKTPVSSILLVDGDTFDNHNAFRAPGTATLERLRERPTKVDYFAGLYGHMHTGIITAHTYITEESLSLLDAATFVFLCLDDAASKHLAAGHLLAAGIPFIDVGMGVEEIDGKLTGLLRMLFAPAGSDPDDITRRIPPAAEERDDYDRNIQVADLNALNGLIAVGRWKRHLGFYADASDETFTTYSLYTNTLSNEASGVDADGTSQPTDPEAGPGR
jgi:molybdopterin/thiamine biosynthesis adenylyltransferase